MFAKWVATAASTTKVERQEWAVLEDGAIAQLSGCCVASDDRDEPTLTDAAFCANVGIRKNTQKRDPALLKSLK
jgi:ketosteroid isomerase-like protein